MIQLGAMNLYSDLMQIKIELLNLFVVSECSLYLLVVIPIAYSKFSYSNGVDYSLSNRTSRLLESSGASVWALVQW